MAEPISDCCDPDQHQLVVRISRSEDADAVAAVCAREVGPSTASVDVVRRVMSFSTECFLTVERLQPGGTAPTVVGFYAYLVLNARGVVALHEGRFDGFNPDLSFLCTPTDTPAALYGWAVAARRINKLVLPEVMQHLSRPRYRDLDFYSRGATPQGAETLLKMGCQPVTPGEDPMSGCLMFLRRRKALAA